MGTAYTPGLTIARALLVRNERRLPLAGEILVSVGEGDAATPAREAMRHKLKALLWDGKVDSGVAEFAR